MNSSKLWINNEKRRYYRVLVYKDLLGDLILMRQWGSLDTARGGSKVELVDGAEAVARLLGGISKQRLKRGYALTEDTKTP